LDLDVALVDRVKILAIYAHTVGGDPLGAHELLPLAATFVSVVGMYFWLFTANVRAAFSWLKKLFRSRRQ
jgi:hypothetical protein